MLPINSNYSKPSSFIYHGKKLLQYHVDRKTLHVVINYINRLLYNDSYNLLLYVDEHMDYIDLSLIRDNIESMKIIYNSNCNMNKMVMISCKDKENLKEIILNYNTSENIYCVISDCSIIKNIRIIGGNNVLTRVNTKNYITIRGYNTNSICVYNSTMTKLELEKIDDLSLNNVYYMKRYVRIGPMTEHIRCINKLDIDDLDRQ